MNKKKPNRSLSRVAQENADKEDLGSETQTARGVVNQDTGDPLISELKRRTKLFVQDNFQNLSPSENVAALLVIENAMLIGGSIVLEQETWPVSERNSESAVSRENKDLVERAPQTPAARAGRNKRWERLNRF